MSGLRRWNLGGLFLGAVLWLAIAAVLPPRFTFGILGKLFLFAPLVVFPLVLFLIRSASRDGKDSILYRAAVIAQPFCAVAVAGSFLLPPGPAAGTLASSWFFLTIVGALFGLYQLLSRGPAPVEEACLDIGLIYFAVGGGWIVLSRLGLHPLGFSDITVLLTAIHFHYAGGALQVIAGLSGRALFGSSPQPSIVRKLYGIALVGIIAGPPLLAAGITFSPGIEWGASLILASSLLLLAILVFFRLIPQKMPWAAKLFLFIAGLSPFLSMGFAGVYAFGEWTGQTLISINYMADVHGMANVFGFVLPSLLAFAFLKPSSRARRPGIPFSRLASRGPTGADFFYRIGAVREKTDSTPMPTGLVDDMKDYERPDFDPRRLDPLLRSFYERTKDFDLTVTPHWTGVFRFAGRFYRKLADAMGQMCLPVSVQGEDQAIDSVILPLRDEKDGRENVRAWVRTYAATGKPVYVAAYASHREDGQTYMNIAFPLPWGNITSVLRLERTEGSSQGLSLTSLTCGPRQGDEGVYFVTKLLPIRLPINETIGVGTNEKDLVARHDMWIFGIKFLTLDYRMRRHDDFA